MTSVLAPRSDQNARVALGLARMLGLRDFRVRFRGTALGLLWGIVPLVAQVAVLSLVVGRLLRTGRPDYPLYLAVGLVVWTNVAQTWSAATLSMTDNASMLRRLPVPSATFPLAALVSAGMASLCSAGLVVVAAGIAAGLSWRIAALPLVLLVHLSLVSGVACALAVTHVRFRDVRYLVDLGLLLGFYGTPVLFLESQVPEGLRALVLVNPLAGLLALWRWTLLGDALSLSRTLCTAGAAAGSALVGVLVLRRSQDHVADLV